jgi:glycosyltransferase involved in cell wall biosynthesis
MDTRSLELLTVVIPARDEEACIASTVEHVYVELRLHNVPHEIIVVDDGSVDRTWEISTASKAAFLFSERCRARLRTDLVARLWPV